MKNFFLLLISGAIITSCGTQAAQETKTLAIAKRDTITILQTADIHGQLLPTQEFFWENNKATFRKLGGMAHMKTLFENERATNPDGIVILDGGDLFQGSAVAALSKGAAFSPVIAEMGYDFLIPGNWEVVYGKQALIDVTGNYHTPVIAANMFDEETGDHLFPPYFIKEVKGVKLGFLSYNDPDIPIRQNPSFSKGMTFTQVDHNLKEMIDKLKDDEGVDILFLVTHIGISKQWDLANNPALERVDYILGNDTHERIRKPLQGKYARVTEPGSFGSFVGKMDLIIENEKIVDEVYELMEVDPEKYPADKKVAAIVEEVMEPYNEKINRVLGHTTVPMFRFFVDETNMDNFLTDIARAKTGADIAISNGFRFAPPIVPGDDGKAAITYGHVWDMIPVDEYVKTGVATGRQIKDWLEKEINNVFAVNPQDRFGGWLVRFSGMELTFDSDLPFGERVIDVKVNGEQLDFDREYLISACRREGEPDHVLCRMPNVKNPSIKDFTMHDVIEEYLKENPVIAPEIDGRARAVNLAKPVLFQLPDTDYSFF